MPLYDYKCDIGHKFELRTDFEDAEIGCIHNFNKSKSQALRDICNRPAYRQIPGKDSSIGIIIK